MTSEMSMTILRACRCVADKWRSHAQHGNEKRNTKYILVPTLSLLLEIGVPTHSVGTRNHTLSDL